MKQKKILLLLIISCIGLTAFSKELPFYRGYDWDVKPEFKIDAPDSTDILTIKDKTVIEFYFETENELLEYKLVHKIIWLNSDDQIEAYNKIYLPISSSSELMITKARFTTKDGIVNTLSKSDILTAEDEETKQTYKYFAFEGVEKGGFIEYYYVQKKFPDYKGTRVFFQTDHDQTNVEFDLFSPSNLIFKFKSFNGLEFIQEDTNEVDKLHWFLHIKFMPKLEREDQSAFNAYLKFLIYKLDRNTTTFIFDISSYAGVAKNAYRFLYKDASKGEIKALIKFLKPVEFENATNERSKIRAIEDYVKKNIRFLDANNPQLSDLEFIIKNKIASENGLLKLYAIAFKQYNINNELVMTCNRNSLLFDEEFEANSFLTDYLFYFPNIKEYMSHVHLGSRLGYPPPQFTDQYGLFIKEVEMGDFTTGIGKIKYIDAISYDKTYDNLLIDMKFKENDLTTVEIKFDRSTGGYNAMGLQPYMHLLDEKVKNDAIDDYIKYLSEQVKIINKNVYNDDASLFGIKPFRVVSELTTDAFVEKAGNKYLLKIGAFIGPQMEMYQDKKRILPVYSPYTRDYHRVITFIIPDGYQISNLNDIDIENGYSENGETLFKFISTHKFEGNKVTVVADEFYKVTEVSPALYEAYRTVINSAADFNKVTLVLEPK